MLKQAKRNPCHYIYICKLCRNSHGKSLKYLSKRNKREVILRWASQSGLAFCGPEPVNWISESNKEIRILKDRVTYTCNISFGVHSNKATTEKRWRTVYQTLNNNSIFESYRFSTFSRFVYLYNYFNKRRNKHVHSHMNSGFKEKDHSTVGYGCRSYRVILGGQASYTIPQFIFLGFTEDVSKNMNI